MRYGHIEQKVVRIVGVLQCRLSREQQHAIHLMHHCISRNLHLSQLLRHLIKNDGAHVNRMVQIFHLNILCDVTYIRDAKQIARSFCFIVCQFEFTVIIGRTTGDQRRVLRHQGDVDKGNRCILHVRHFAGNAVLSLCGHSENQRETCKEHHLFHKHLNLYLFSERVASDVPQSSISFFSMVSIKGKETGMSKIWTALYDYWTGEKHWLSLFPMFFFCSQCDYKSPLERKAILMM